MQVRDSFISWILLLCGIILRAFEYAIQTVCEYGEEIFEEYELLKTFEKLNLAFGWRPRGVGIGLILFLVKASVCMDSY